MRIKVNKISIVIFRVHIMRKKNTLFRYNSILEPEKIKYCLIFLFKQ